MATVCIQKRKCKSRNIYTVIYKDPVTRKSIYSRTFRKYCDATYAADLLPANRSINKVRNLA